MLPDIDMKSLYAWMEKHEAYEPPPSPWNPPRYALETLTERIEPFATHHDELNRERPGYYDPEWSEPDPEFYRPTERLRDLDQRLGMLRAKGFRDAPNPDYDPVRAEAWRRTWQAGPVDQIQIWTGQSYTPESTP